MTGLLVAWVVFPLVMGILSLGCGLLVEHASGLRIPGVLLIPLGLAVIIVAADLVTAISATAQFAVSIVVALSVAGIGLSYPWRGRRPDGWALATGVAVFAVYAAPIVLSGNATFAGYITLDDTNTWLALADRALEHGRSLSGLAPSTYQVVLSDYFSSGYPLGAFLPLGIGGKLVAEDIAWLFQPMIALFAAALACSIYSLCGDLVRHRPLRAAAAFLGAQAALLFSYAAWSGIKEVATAFLLALLPGLILLTLGRRGNARSTLPVAIAGAAVFAVLGIAGGVWLIVPGLAALLLLFRNDLRPFTRRIPVLVGGVLALSAPSFALASSFLSKAAGGDVTSSNEVANLGHPLPLRQIFGIWPASDFRLAPAHSTTTNILITVLALSAAYAFYEGWRKKAWGTPLYLALSALGALLVLGLKVIGLGSPWLDAKAMAEASPGLVAAGVVGACVLLQAGRWIVAVVPAAVIAGGVLWSNALTYQGVWLAPQGQLAELQQIGNDYPGQGPTLLTEYQPYGARHFLRNMDPEAVSERRARFIALRVGGDVPRGDTADVDEIVLNDLLVYRTLVLRTSPGASRPPSAYSLVRRTRWYEVWQRPEPSGLSILEHLSLGGRGLDVSAVPNCDDILRLGSLARQSGGRLAISRRGDPAVIDLGQVALPAGWLPTTSPGAVVPAGSGTLALDATVPTSGVYRLWLGGSFRRRVTLTVDGQPAGSIKHHLNNAGQYTGFGTVPLTAGSHRVILRYDGSNLSPGAGNGQFGMGPFVIAADSPAGDAVSFVDPTQARSLCGRSFDWVEALSG